MSSEFAARERVPARREDLSPTSDRYGGIYEFVHSRAFPIGDVMGPVQRASRPSVAIDARGCAVTGYCWDLKDSLSGAERRDIHKVATR